MWVETLNSSSGIGCPTDRASTKVDVSAMLCETGDGSVTSVPNINKPTGYTARNNLERDGKNEHARVSAGHNIRCASEIGQRIGMKRHGVCTVIFKIEHKKNVVR